MLNPELPRRPDRTVPSDAVAAVLAVAADRRSKQRVLRLLLDDQCQIVGEDEVVS